MKWKNIDVGSAYYYITSTFTDWLPLFHDKRIFHIVREEITTATTECGGHISAYVFMPEHLHLLSYLEGSQLHRYCKLWRGRSARRIAQSLAEDPNRCFGISMPKRAQPGTPEPPTLPTARQVLVQMASHANGTATHAVWKEQPRALAIWDESKLGGKVSYIHNNPVARGLATHPGDWQFSSWNFYEGDGRSLLPIHPWR